jgi:hypothetical protein
MMVFVFVENRVYCYVCVVGEFLCNVLCGVGFWLFLYAVWCGVECVLRTVCILLCGVVCVLRRGCGVLCGVVWSVC